jgi:conjugative transposon TraJ protein
VLQVCYEAAALCINTIRTFYLVVLAILGPVVLGLSVFDGFQHILTSWLAKYINVFLWLPVANIFGAIIGKVQENMLKLDISQVQSSGDTFFSATDTAYLIFLIIGIIGYFTVPSVANYIVNPGGGNGLLQKVNTIVSSAAQAGSGTVAGMRNEAMNSGGAPGNRGEGYNGNNGKTTGYQEQKLSGKTSHS